MTTHEAKQDAKKRLAAHNLTYTRLTAKTHSFDGFGYGRAIFVEVYGVKDLVWDSIREGLKKPSEGGYILKFK